MHGPKRYKVQAQLSLPLGANKIKSHDISVAPQEGSENTLLLHGQAQL